MSLVFEQIIGSVIKMVQKTEQCVYIIPDDGKENLSGNSEQLPGTLFLSLPAR
jgi:hypothetical protein